MARSEANGRQRLRRCPAGLPQRPLLVRCLAAWLLLPLPVSAAADIYSFVDEGGIPHFSNVPQDRRYRVFLRAPDAAAAAPGLRQRGRGVLPPRLFSQHVELAGQASQVAPALIHAVISAESGHNPRALSRKGAMGLMQLMPETARRYCVDDPFDPVQNIRGGVAYLRDLMRQFDSNLPLVLAAYNAGETAVQRHGNRIPPYAETRQYVPRVLDLYDRFSRDGKPAPPAAPLPATASAPCPRWADGGPAATGDRGGTQ